MKYNDNRLVHEYMATKDYNIEEAAKALNCLSFDAWVDIQQVTGSCSEYDEYERYIYELLLRVEI
tara:strand:+ start:554 stop:748 length:195 start_codon:yes stop_codon:yes gene_type:complete